MVVQYPGPPIWLLLSPTSQDDHYKTVFYVPQFKLSMSSKPCLSTPDGLVPGWTAVPKEYIHNMQNYFYFKHTVLKLIVFMKSSKNPPAIMHHDQRTMQFIKNLTAGNRLLFNRKVRPLLQPVSVWLDQFWQLHVKIYSPTRPLFTKSNSLRELINDLGI